MLNRTRPESPVLVPLDLNAQLERIFDATAPALDARSVRLRPALGSIPLIAGDVDRLQQVFINLINNALDAMPDGGELRVSTGADEDEQHEARVFVEFADTGCGMAEQVRAHIFDPLYTTKEHGRGTGLGLVVVRQAMSDHGGQIEVESQMGKGTRFRLWFPVERSVTVVEDSDSSRRQAVEEAQTR